MHSGIFGVVLAIQLCKSDSFFEAYCHAVVVMISGKARIEEVLVGEFGHGHEVVDRLVGAVDMAWTFSYGVRLPSLLEVNLRYRLLTPMPIDHAPSLLETWSFQLTEIGVKRVTSWLFSRESGQPSGCPHFRPRSFIGRLILPDLRRLRLLRVASLLAWISAMRCLKVVPLTHFLDLSIPDLPLKGDELPLLERLGEA